jgi:hypothetical protein
MCGATANLPVRFHLFSWQFFFFTGPIGGDLPQMWSPAFELELAPSKVSRRVESAGCHNHDALDFRQPRANIGA